MRLLALGAVTFAAIGAATALGATADTPYEVVRVDSPDPQFGGQFGVRLAAAGDLTGDGVRDVFTTSLGQTVDGAAGAGMVTLIDGATRESVYSGPDPPMR